MRTVCVTTIMVLNLAGCVAQGPQHFEKAGMTAEQRNKDFGNCAMAEKSPPGVNVQIGGYANRARWGYTGACMQSKGYVRRDCRRCEPSQFLAN